MLKILSISMFFFQHNFTVEKQSHLLHGKQDGGGSVADRPRLTIVENPPTAKLIFTA